MYSLLCYENYNFNDTYNAMKYEKQAIQVIENVVMTAEMLCNMKGMLYKQMLMKRGNYTKLSWNMKANL